MGAANQIRLWLAPSAEAGYTFLTDLGTSDESPSLSAAARKAAVQLPAADVSAPGIDGTVGTDRAEGGRPVRSFPMAVKRWEPQVRREEGALFSEGVDIVDSRKYLRGEPWGSVYIQYDEEERVRTKYLSTYAAVTRKHISRSSLR